MELGLNLVMVRPDAHARDRRARRGGGLRLGVRARPRRVPGAGRRAPTRTAPTGRSRSPLDTPLHDPWVILSTDRRGDVDHRARHRRLRARAAPPVRHCAGGHLPRRPVGRAGDPGRRARDGWQRSSPPSASSPSAGSRGPRSASRCCAPSGPRRRNPSTTVVTSTSTPVHFAPRPVERPAPADPARRRLRRRAGPGRALRRRLDVGRGRHRGRGDRGAGHDRAGAAPASTAPSVAVRDHRPVPAADAPTTSPGSTALGVDRVVVMPWNRGRDAIPALEAFAETAIGSA